MSFLENGFHPSFDALSALADTPDLAAARGRVARHAARCATCAASVAEIRAMGDAARALEPVAPPPALWARVRDAQADAASRPAPRQTPPPEAEPWKSAPSLRPTTHVPMPSRRALRRTAGALAAAAAVVAALLVPSSAGPALTAGGRQGVWRFTPDRPAPGSAVSVRYEPAADERPPRRMLLLADFVRSADDPFAGGADQRELLDSVGVLVRQRDGAYAGRFILPVDARVMVARLADSTGNLRSRLIGGDGVAGSVHEPVGLLIAGDGSGRPSLDALTRAAERWSASPHGAYRIADTLIRYFPGEPIGYAVAPRVEPRRLLDDLIAWYRRGERRYARFDERLSRQSRVPVHQAAAMVRFAQRIEEPGEVRKWTLRLVREHPQEPAAIQLYGLMLSRMLSRDHTSDSVRLALPLADTLWERNGGRYVDADLASTAARVGDREASRRWAQRAAQQGAGAWRGAFGFVMEDHLEDATYRHALEPLLLDRVRDRCVVPPGKFPLSRTRERWQLDCQVGRSAAFGSLSAIARLEGESGRALALADSSLATMERSGRCWAQNARVQRGAALLAMGDTVAAARELAWAANRGSWQSEAFGDSVARRLRPAVDSAAWRAHIDRARVQQAACTRAALQRSRERRARELADARRDSLTR